MIDLWCIVFSVGCTNPLYYFRLDWVVKALWNLLNCLHNQWTWTSCIEFIVVVRCFATPLLLSIMMSLLFSTHLVPLICYLQVSWLNEHSEVKRKKLEIKLESDDANDNFSFPETMSRRDKRGEEAGRFVSHRYSLLSCTYIYKWRSSCHSIS